MPKKKPGPKFSGESLGGDGFMLSVRFQRTLYKRLQREAKAIGRERLDRKGRVSYAETVRTLCLEALDRKDAIRAANRSRDTGASTSA